MFRLVLLIIQDDVRGNRSERVQLKEEDGEVKKLSSEEKNTSGKKKKKKQNKGKAEGSLILKLEDPEITQVRSGDNPEITQVRSGDNSGMNRR